MEFIIVLPFLLTVLMIIAEFSRAWMTLNVVAAAAREGARIGAANTCGTPPCPFDNTLALARITNVLAGANLTASATSPPTVTCCPVTATVTVDFSTNFPAWPLILPGMPGIPLTNVAVFRFEGATP